MLTKIENKLLLLKIKESLEALFLLLINRLKKTLNSLTDDMIDVNDIEISRQSEIKTAEFL